MKPLYLWQVDDETVGLLIVNTNCRPFRQSLVGRRKLAIMESDDTFRTAVLIVMAGEYEMRKTVELLEDSATRNIKQNVRRCHNYLMDIYREGRMKRDMGTGIKKMNYKEFQNRVEVAMGPVRELLGLHEADHFFLISEPVIQAAVTKECRRFLERTAVFGPVYPVKYDEISGELRDKFPDEANVVVEALKATKTREALSVVSLSELDGELFVTLVNPNRELVRMESWRFILMLENPEKPITLWEFPLYGEQKSNTSFAFKNHKAGRIVGKLDASGSRIMVACVKSPKPPCGDRATFIMDATYAACLYFVLARLRGDAIEFQKLLEKAITEEVVEDPFLPYM